MSTYYFSLHHNKHRGYFELTCFSDDSTGQVEVNSGASGCARLSLYRVLVAWTNHVHITLANEPVGGCDVTLSCNGLHILGTNYLQNRTICVLSRLLPLLITYNWQLHSSHAFRLAITTVLFRIVEVFWITMETVQCVIIIPGVVFCMVCRSNVCPSAKSPEQVVLRPLSEASVVWPSTCL